MVMNTSFTKYHKVIDFFGTNAQAAEAIKVSRSNIANWKSRGIPAKHAITIEVLTGGKIKASELIS